MRIDPVALELLQVLAQYSTYDEVVFANKLFCIQGPWISVGDLYSLSWYRKKHDWILTIYRSGEVASRTTGIPKHITQFWQILEKLSCAK